MNFSYPFFVSFLCSSLCFGQVVINEIDSDTPSTDTQEIIELKSITPNYALDGYIVVLFNGSENGMDSSYLALDLDGYMTDANGILVLGGPELSPVPQFRLFSSTLQNGADAVAIYRAPISDFENGTLATTTGLIDAVVYDTDDADDTALMQLLGVTAQINEDENNKKTSESIQRTDDGNYEVKSPTPGMPNDGSGIQFNGMTLSVSTNELQEGTAFDIVLIAQTAVASDTMIELDITNQGFSMEDYTGTTSVVIPSGMQTARTTIQTINDSDDEGDEEIIVRFTTIPSGFIRLNDYLSIALIDNDFSVARWGTPIAPTYTEVQSTAPEQYYTSLDGLTSNALSHQLRRIIADPTTVRAHTYADAIAILKEADQSPLNSNKVWLVYSEEERAKVDFQTSGSSATGKWNREHTYPRSRGNFFSIKEDAIADGIAIYTTTNADSLRHANTDAHGLRAADGPENSARSNQDYGEYTGPEATQGSWKGDVARSIFFLATRYKGLKVVPGDPANTTTGQLGDLNVLLEWHRSDPPDDFEMHRNNVIYEWQRNRNPFIDHPELVEHIWGNQVGVEWKHTLSVATHRQPIISILPNPSKGTIYFTGLDTITKVVILDSRGTTVFHTTSIIRQSIAIHHLPKGIYTALIYSGQKRHVERFIK